MSEDKIIKRTHVMLRKREMEKLQQLTEDSGMSASEVIRFLINTSKGFKVQREKQ